MRHLLGIVLLLQAFALYAVPSQDEVLPQAESNYEFVSGIVSDLPPGKIVVNRAVLGKPPENRTFSITAETKIEGRLRPRVRVTVGFRTTEDGEPVAVRIIVRPQAGNGKK
ncbi:MAG: hypothetical protein H7039_17530 [Bryobacteraceae bacterium]|nr:hypothetical protein [Bryobacteraceae bacterium]